MNHLTLRHRLAIQLFFVLSIGYLSIFSTAIGFAQTSVELSNGVPHWVISSTPASALLQPAIWTGRTMYRIGESARDFVTFSVNKPGYVYIWQVDASGNVQLLLPGSPQQDSFFPAGPHPLSQPFDLPKAEGTHFLQIVASPLPLKLAKDSSEPFPATPLAARKLVLAKIAQRQLASGEWGASWTHYQTAPAAPVSANSFTQVTVRAVEGDCKAGSEVRDALVYLDDDKTPFTAFAPITVLRNDHRVRAEAVGYRTKTLPVRVTGPEAQEVCVMLPLDKSIRGKAYFTFNAAPKAYDNVIFDASRSHGLLYEWDFGDGSPIATGERAGHAYLFSGNFLVHLMVRFFDGETEDTVLPVQVKPSEPCPSSLSTFPACQGGTRGTNLVTLETSEPRQVHLAMLDQPLAGQDAQFKFEVSVDRFPMSATQTSSAKVESYLQFDLYDKSFVRLNSARVYTVNTILGGLSPLPGQTQSLKVSLGELFGVSDVAKAGRVQVGAVLNVQDTPSLVRVTYRLAESSLSALAVTPSSPGTTPPASETPQPQPSGGGGDFTVLVIVGLVVVAAIIAIVLFALPK
ncbi:DUF4384 domain-containing protein [Candidatus Acetothermia bacterium]|nr:DUF4384 domain-containing protein [Candidatus Acetothermia bacterium]